MDQLPYCNQTDEGGTQLYKTSVMTWPWYTYPCAEYDEIETVFPPEELNAMFVTTRLSTTNRVYPSGAFRGTSFVVPVVPANVTPFPPVRAPPTGCDPSIDVNCNYLNTTTNTTYVANTEFFTLKLDHTLDIPLFGVFRPGTDLQYLGIQDIDGNNITLCDGALWARFLRMLA